MARSWIVSVILNFEAHLMYTRMTENERRSSSALISTVFADCSFGFQSLDLWISTQCAVYAEGRAESNFVSLYRD